MGLINNQLIMKGEDLPVREKVVEEKVVIDYKDIRIREGPVMSVVETVIVEWTLPPAAVIRVAADSRPKIRDKGELVFIAGRYCGNPVRKSVVRLPCLYIFLLPLETEVVILPLEEGKGKIMREDLL